MGKKRQARKLREQSKMLDEKKGDLDWFLVNCLYLCSAIGIIILSQVTDRGSPDYDYIHNGIFVFIILGILSYIVRQNVTNHMYQSVRKLLFENARLDLYEKGDIALALTYLLIFISIFFVDLSFLKSSGLRVPAVAAIGIYELLRKFVFSKKK